jgi:hypothetical protein
MPRGSPVNKIAPITAASIVTHGHGELCCKGRVRYSPLGPVPSTAHDNRSSARRRSGIHAMPWTMPRWTSWPVMAPPHW